MRYLYWLVSAAVIFWYFCPELCYGDETGYAQKKWSSYNRHGEYDSIVNSARPVFDAAMLKGDSGRALYAAVMVAQGYLFSNNLDAVREWMMKVDSLVDSGAAHSLYTMSIVYNCKAIYALKLNLDYSEALKYFLKGYDAATAEGIQEFRVALLSNITHIFYLRSSADGMPYAQKALEIADSCALSDYGHCLANLSMSQMLYLTRDYDRALQYCRISDSLCRAGDFASQVASIEILYGDIYTSYGEYPCAGRHYSRAFDYLPETEPGIVPLVFLNYGKCLEMQGKIQDAVRLYEEGLGRLQDHGSMEFRIELLQRLTDVYCDMDNPVMFKEYYQKYRAMSVSMADREREFNALILSNQEMRHELERKSDELAIIKFRRNAVMWACVSFTTIVLLVSFFYMWRKQKKMYGVLMDKYSHYARQKEILKDGGDSAEKELFEKIKSLMENERVFVQKDISIDRIAELTCSNRTYVSKAVNMCAGQSFPVFLNSYRINEAVRYISDLKNDMPLKQIAEAVGFTTMSVFYNAFCKEVGMPPGRYRRELMNRKKVPDCLN